MLLLGDFVTPGDQYGIFVFAVDGLLSGIEVFQIAAVHPCAELPCPSDLSPVVWTENRLVRRHTNG